MFVLIWVTLLFSVGSNNANTALIQKPTVTIPPLTDGQQATLTCIAPGLCSGSDPEITWTWRRAGENDSHITGNITAVKTENLTAVTKRCSSTLTFNPLVIHHGTEVTCKVSFTNNITTEETVTLNVTYVKKPEITEETTEKDGDDLTNNESFPSSNKNLHNGTETELQNSTVSPTVVIPNVTAEHTRPSISYPKILSSSGCINQTKVLTCMCISEGFPLPTIRWPLLENHTEYSLITTVSNHTANSTVTLTIKDQSNAVVECVSSNKNGEVKGNLNINIVEEEDQRIKLLRSVTRLEIIIAFLIGCLLSAVICCLVRKCLSKKQRSYGNLAETLEMVTSQENPLINAGQEVEEYQAAIDQDAAEAGGAAEAGKSDVEYSNLDFFLIKRPAEAGTTKGTTETEYAEIKKEKAEERHDGEEEEEMVGENEETKPDEEEGEDAALYSTVKDIMAQI